MNAIPFSEELNFCLSEVVTVEAMALAECSLRDMSDAVEAMVSEDFKLARDHYRVSCIAAFTALKRIEHGSKELAEKYEMTNDVADVLRRIQDTLNEMKGDADKVREWLEEQQEAANG